MPLKAVIQLLEIEIHTCFVKHKPTILKCDSIHYSHSATELGQGLRVRVMVRVRMIHVFGFWCAHEPTDQSQFLLTCEIQHTALWK